MSKPAVAPALPTASVAERPIPGGPQPRGFLATFVLAWFGITIATSAVIGAAIPKVFAFLDDATKGTNLSIVAAVGGIVVILSTPLLGRLSDRTMSRFGMRRPWILAGALVGLAGVLLLAFVDHVVAIALGWSIVQLGFGAANAAVHALLADQIPTRIRARVSAAAGAAAAIALIVGAAAVAILPNDQQWAWFVVPGLLGGATTVLLAFRLHDLVRTEPPAPWRWRDVLSTYWISPRRHPDFAWAWLCRLLVTMSILSVSTYLLFFIIDHLGVPKEQASGVQATTLLIYTAGNIVTMLVFGWISDRTGRRKPIIWISSLLSVAGLGLAIASADVAVFMAGIAIVGAAQGAYVSVDVALMTEVLPSYDDAGKDLGIVALSYQVPQVLVPIIAVPLLAIGAGENYSALFVAAIVMGLAGGLAVLPIRGVR